MPSLEPRHRGCQCFVCPHQMLMREPRGARGPIEWPNIASVLAVDEQTVAFGDYNRETASHRATLAPVDNCADVDKMCLPPGRIGAPLTPWAVVRSALPTHLRRRSGSTPKATRRSNLPPLPSRIPMPSP